MAAPPGGQGARRDEPPQPQVWKHPVFQRAKAASSVHAKLRIDIVLSFHQGPELSAQSIYFPSWTDFARASIFFPPSAAIPKPEAVDCADCMGWGAWCEQAEGGHSSGQNVLDNWCGLNYP